MGQTTLTPEELEAMLDRAAKRGSTQALAAIGLHDENAAIDVREMRSLLEAWRDTRKSIWNTSIKLLTVAVLTFISGAVWMTINKG
jgi:2-iminoacetate synthase ThiH